MLLYAVAILASAGIGFGLHGVALRPAVVHRSWQFWRIRVNAIRELFRTFAATCILSVISATALT
jgi:hypothetical protein